MIYTIARIRSGGIALGIAEASVRMSIGSSKLETKLESDSLPLLATDTRRIPQLTPEQVVKVTTLHLNLH